MSLPAAPFHAPALLSTALTALVSSCTPHPCQARPCPPLPRPSAVHICGHRHPVWHRVRLPVHLPGLVVHAGGAQAGPAAGGSRPAAGRGELGAVPWAGGSVTCVPRLARLPCKRPERPAPGRSATRRSPVPGAPSPPLPGPRRTSSCPPSPAPSSPTPTSTCWAWEPPSSPCRCAARSCSGNSCHTTGAARAALYQGSASQPRSPAAPATLPSHRKPSPPGAGDCGQPGGQDSIQRLCRRLLRRAAGGRPARGL